jgi:heparan-alpha-glucosaminide N-acetyltransferase
MFIDWEFLPPSPASNSTLNQASSALTVKCGVRGDVGPACNVVGYLDRTLLGINHLHPRPVYQRTPDCSTKSPDYGPLPPGAPNWCKAPFDPEGLLSSLSSVGSCFIGLHFGHVLVHCKEHYSRIWHWFFPALGLLAVGLMLHILGMEFNKPLYSFSYLCFTGGAAGLVLTGFYLLVSLLLSLFHPEHVKSPFYFGCPFNAMQKRVNLFCFLEAWLDLTT